ncbi:MAG: RNA polymerase subunit sigma-70 [Kofleriaceae bacterium]
MFVRDELEPHRRAIIAHCYRMLGSLSDAEDLAQESVVRAWQKRDERTAAASTRAWLYAIATRVCLDTLRRRKRRERRAEIVGSDHLETYAHVGPFPDSPVGLEHELLAREHLKLAFIAALQLLPAKQRAALLLVDVLGWSPADAATTLETTQAALNSLLQRARRTAGVRAQVVRGSAVDDHAALERFIAAWQSGDPDGLAAILAADARLAMPPGAEVYVGREAITRFLGPVVHRAPGSYRLVPVAVNNSVGVAIYKKRDGGTFTPSGVSVLEIEAGLVKHIVRFDASAELFARFGLPPSAPAV